MSASASLPADVATHPLVRIAADLSLMAWEQMTVWRAALGDDFDASVVDTKTSPNDLVTKADAQIESLVRGYLEAVRPHDRMVGEEGTEALDPVGFFDPDLLRRLYGFDPGTGALAEVGTSSASADRGALGDDRLEWHVDPIDGTVNFVRGIEHFAFSVGIRRLDSAGADAASADQAVAAVNRARASRHSQSDDPAGAGSPAGAENTIGDPGEWLVGLVASPGLGATFVGVGGLGAYRVQGRLLDRMPEPGALGESARAATLAPGDISEPAGSIPAMRLTGQPAGLSGRVLATGFAYKGDSRARQLGKLDALMGDYDDIRRCGSAALDLCMVAEGKVTAYAERGIGIHDYAGGALIAEESGAFVHRGGTGGPTAAADSLEELERLIAAI